MTSQPDLAAHVRNFHNCRVVIVGDVMLDEYLWGQVQRICPEAPVPIVEEVRRSRVPGGMANVAVNVAALGAQVAVAGVVGEDAQGESLRGMLNLLGIDTTGIRIDPQRPTTAKTRIIAHNQQVVRIDREHAHPLSSAIEQGILDWLSARLSTADVCILSDYSKGVLSPALTSKVIALTRHLGRAVVVDPKGWDYRRYRGASVITPNLHEARMALTNGAPPPDDRFALGQGLLKLLPGTSVLITCGSEGVVLFREGSDPLTIPSEARQVYDVTGAGDTLVATLAVAVAAGCRLDVAATLANSAAGVAVGKVGTAAVSANELLAVSFLTGPSESPGDLTAMRLVPSIPLEGRNLRRPA